MPASDPWWVRPDWGGSPVQAAKSPGTGWHGPYPDQKAALLEQANKGQPAGTSQGPLTGGALPGPLGVLGHFVGGLAAHLADGPMWRSLGWLALGIALMFTGIYLWFRTSATYKTLESSITGAVKAL